MKKILLIILTLSFTLELYSQDNVKEFNNTLGRDQSIAFDQAVESFKKFLEINYSGQESLADQNSEFLKDFRSIYNDGPPNWKFPNDIKKVLERWEETGLRREIRLWPNESYKPKYLPEWNDNDSTSEEEIEVEIEDEIIPIRQRNGETIQEPTERDSSLYSNTFGKYLYALDKCCSADSAVSDYIEVKWNVGDISPSLIAGAYSDLFRERLNDPILMRMIVAELYYWLMRSELKKENKN